MWRKQKTKTYKYIDTCMKYSKFFIYVSKSTYSKCFIKNAYLYHRTKTSCTSSMIFFFLISLFNQSDWGISKWEKMQKWSSNLFINFKKESSFSKCWGSTSSWFVIPNCKLKQNLFWLFNSNLKTRTEVKQS